MTTIEIDVGAKPRVGRRFYLIMALVLAAVVVFGFSHTVPSDLTAPGLPILLQLHAAVFSTWVLLFVAQPALVFRGSLSLHRKLGWFGAALAAAMVVMGAGAVLFALRGGSVPPFYPHGLFLVRGVLGLLVFGALVTAGVSLRRRPEWHKRLLLCASIAVIVPGLERAGPFFLLGSAWPYAVDGIIDLIALAGPIVDLAARRRIHPAYLWGVGSLLLGQIVVDLLAPSPVATAGLELLGVH